VSAAALLRAATGVLRPFGLNLLGAAEARAYDALVPPAYRLVGASDARASVIVIGNGGGAFWAAYETHAARHRGWAARAHPLDDFTLRIMEEHLLPLADRLGVPASLRVPFRPSVPPLSFVHLAEAAGLGRRSVLGVLIHPEFGPWIALRGALLVDGAVRAPHPASGFDPCPSCLARPCVAACPGHAVAYPDGWDVPRCIDYRLAEAGACADRCHARIACVYGRAHRYPASALAHHQGRAFAVMAGARRAASRPVAPRRSSEPGR
jgi:epoxyqueuosine reductase